MWSNGANPRTSGSTGFSAPSGARRPESGPLGRRLAGPAWSRRDWSNLKSAGHRAWARSGRRAWPERTWERTVSIESPEDLKGLTHVGQIVAEALVRLRRSVRVGVTT